MKKFGEFIGMIPRKILVILILAICFGSFYLFDYVRAQGFHIEVVSVSPEPVVADGTSSCDLVIKLTDRKGNPVQGHNLFVYIVEGSGNFAQQRNTTDEDGLISLNYKPLRASKYNPAQDALIEIYDESNSIFLAINAKIRYEIQVVE